MSLPNQLIENIRLNHVSRAPLVSTTAQQSERGNDMDRRQCLGAMLLAAAATIAPAASAQDSYPSRLVKVVVGFPAGSAADVAARAVAEALAKRLGQPFIVDNRPGAASNIAAKAVATSAPDGYTIFVGTVANTINVAFADANSRRPGKGFRRGHDDWQRAEHTGGESLTRRYIGRPVDPCREGRSRARSLMLPRATARRRIYPVSCSPPWPASRCCTCRTVAARRL